MGAIGTNLQRKRSPKKMSLLFKLMGYKAVQAPRKINAGVSPNIFIKAGIPASNTEADAPEGLNDLIIDITNNDIFRCTAYTDSSTFTLLKIKD